MIIIGADWHEILAHNLSNAAFLWAAWAGGAASILEGHVRLRAPITIHSGSLVSGAPIQADEDEDEEADEIEPIRHLQLVD